MEHCFPVVNPSPFFLAAWRLDELMDDTSGVDFHWKLVKFFRELAPAFIPSHLHHQRSNQQINPTDNTDPENNLVDLNPCVIWMVCYTGHSNIPCRTTVMNIGMACSVHYIYFYNIYMYIRAVMTTKSFPVYLHKKSKKILCFIPSGFNSTIFKVCYPLQDIGHLTLFLYSLILQVNSDILYDSLKN